MRVADLIEECFKRTKMLRTDLGAMDEFDKAISSDSTLDGVKLFWEVWRPRYTLVEGSLLGDQDNPPALDDDLEDGVLEELARLERECRISYVPDEDLIEEHLEDAIQYVHVGAASALRRRKRDDLTEDVLDTLQRVSRILHLVGINYNRNRLSVSYLAEAPHDMVSQFGARSLVLRELAKARSVDGKYQEAFEMAFDSFVCAEAVWDVATLDREFLIEVFGEEALALEEETRAAIRRCLPLQSPQQIVNCFEGLRRQNKSDDWRLVAHQCARLAQTIDDDLSESSVLDGNHQELDWYGYWRRAQGWAEEHLGPQEFREFLRGQEEEASRDRLERYFFGELWEKIPPKAREHLVNVDSAWFDKSRGRALGAVLNDLQVAAEVICHSFIREPLESLGDQSLLRILARDREPQDAGRSPTLPDYARVCEGDGFKKFVQEQGVSSDERRFLRQRLPKALRKLSELRNPAQHVPERRMRREEVEPLVQSFLGIGRPGVLRSLIEVGQKLISK